MLTDVILRNLFQSCMSALFSFCCLKYLAPPGRCFPSRPARDTRQSSSLSSQFFQCVYRVKKAIQTRNKRSETKKRVINLNLCVCIFNLLIVKAVPELPGFAIEVSGKLKCNDLPWDIFIFHPCFSTALLCV